ncbi:MAG: alpha-galactosidase [Herpetosiphonaceae bacterium]|nr:alpha-galactosidase [Herpetosiphonaceae bacterium]
MVEAQATPTIFTDIHLVETPEVTITYRSGLLAYQEALVRGQWIGCGWNGSGYTNPPSEHLDPAKYPAPQAFWLEVEGQLLHSFWEYRGAQQHNEPGANGDLLHSIIELGHTLRPITVRIHTRLDGTPLLTRWLEIINTGDHAAPINSAFPWSGVLQTTSHTPDTTTSPYSIGYMIDTHWGNEGDFAWRELPYASYRIDGRYRRDRHRQPFFVLRNHQTGEHWVGTLAWSGGYVFDFDLDDGYSRGSARLHFRAGPDAPPPLRVLDPGETVTTPEMHLGMVIGELDDCVHALHDHLRASVLQPQEPELAGRVESGIGPEQEITYELVYHELEVAASVGAELFFVDASWYSALGAPWWNTVGDWEVGSRFPAGLAPIRDRVHAKGMLWGLWMDAERIGSESKLSALHPEWFVRRYDDQREPGGMLDLTQPDAAAWMEHTIDQLITEHQLDFFRLDYNIGNVGPAGYHLHAGFAENIYWRYYEALYAIYGRLRGHHPAVIFENCASGGARADAGMLRYFNHTWITDWQIAPRSFSITNGMTLALPPERVDRLLGMGQSGQRAATLDFQARLLLFVHPTLGWFHLKGAQPNPKQLARVRHMVNIYKEFVRPFQATSRIYHHTPVVTGYDPHGWGVLELAAQDRTQAIIGLFRLSDPATPEYLLRLRGLELGRRYRVTFDNSGDCVVLDGFTLCNLGLSIRLESALTSELLIVKADD